ncbi:MAG: hypothetical protein ACJ8J0_13990 [Longimicrobiaceae bacterium]
MRPLAETLAATLALAALAAAPAPAQAPAPAGARPAVLAAPAPAQAPGALPAGDVYRREVFRYQRGGRPDPFQPLLTAAELGFRVEDLRLTAIIYSPSGRSVAVFAAGDSARRYRLRQGQRLGTMTVTRIYPQRVDVRVDEFGGSRMQSVPLVRAQRIQQAAQAADGSAAQGQQLPVTITPAPQQPQAPRVLRRGPIPAAQAAGQPAAPAPAPAPAPPSVNPRAPSYTSGTRPR